MKNVYILIDSYTPEIEVYENPLDVFYNIVNTLNYYYKSLNRFSANTLVRAIEELANSYESLEETDFFGCSIDDLSLSCYKKEIH